MSNGAGHIMDMINRMKQNRALRPSSRQKFKEHSRDKIYLTNKKAEQTNFKTITEKELTKIKKQIRDRANTERKKVQFLYGVFIICGLISIIGILIWLN